LYSTITFFHSVFLFKLYALTKITFALTRNIEAMLNPKKDFTDCKITLDLC